MSAEINVYATSEEWLKARTSYIGGSDAGCIIGVNPWKSNVDLWEEKTGLKKHEEIKGNPLIEYGKNAEWHLRELFRLDYPQYVVGYDAHNMWTNSEYPWAHASLDGWLTDTENGKHGILEIKTATISGAAQKAKWEDGIPQTYYVQVLHYLMVTDFDFAIVKAQLKYEYDGKEPWMVTRHYRIDRSDVIEDIEYLKEKEKEFAESIKNGQRPALTLPEI